MVAETLDHGAVTDSPQPSPQQVRLQLTTRHAEISLPNNTGPILVNSSLRRYALSTLVNTLLETAKPIPLEFLINGTFLRTSIDEYLTANGISSETTLTVEYVRAIIPPLYLASFEHDDWVSSVDVFSGGAGHGKILSASYDGLLRVWNMSSEILATSPSAIGGGHASSAKAAQFVSSTQIVSSGIDRTVKLWKYAEDAEGFSAALSPQIELYGHKASIDSLATHQPSHRILSASADHSVGIWSTKKSDAPAAPAALIPSTTSRGSKRRKLNTSVSIPQRGPLSMMKSHSAPVSSVIFAPNDSTVAYTTSWDHTMKTWDLPTSTSVDTRTTSHSLLSVAALPNLNLVAAGTSARHITLIDPRASATTISAMILRGHTNAVISLASDPGSTYGLLSGSHDGTCRIWDVRSSKSEKDGRIGESIYTISRESANGEPRKPGGEGVKVFSVAWDAEVGIISGGEDRRVQINRGKGIVGQQQ